MLLKMSSAWNPPKEDSPSVLSDRVYSIRRLNKMESQRLNSQLNYLNAEIAQSNFLISQEQTALRKELEQIRKVKDNPSVGLEKRKLLQQNSHSKSQTIKHGLSFESRVAQPRIRSLSIGQAPMQSSPLTPLCIRQRSKSSTCPPLCSGVGELSAPMYAMNRVQKSPCTARQSYKRRSFSTGTQPQIWELETGLNARPSGVPGPKVDDSEVFTDTKAQNRKSCKRLEDKIKRDLNCRGPPRLIPLDFRQKVHEAGRIVPEKLISNRRVRSYATNSTPIISEGRVVGLSGNSTTVPPQAVDAASQRPRCFTTSCIPKAIEEEKLCVPLDNPVRHGATVRLRSLSTNCPPVILEKGGTTQAHSVLESSLQKKPFKGDDREMTSGLETEEKIFSSEHVQNDAELPKGKNGSKIDSQQPTSSEEVSELDSTGHNDGISLPLL